MKPQPCTRILKATNAACGLPATKFLRTFAVCDEHLSSEDAVYNSITPSRFRYCGKCRLQGGLPSTDFHEVRPGDADWPPSFAEDDDLVLRCPNCRSVFREGAFPYLVTR